MALTWVADDLVDLADLSPCKPNLTELTYQLTDQLSVARRSAIAMLVARACRPRELACPKRAAVRYCVGKAHIDGPRPQLTDIVASSLQM